MTSTMSTSENTPPHQLHDREEAVKRVLADMPEHALNELSYGLKNGVEWNNNTDELTDKFFERNGNRPESLNYTINGFYSQVEKKVWLDGPTTKGETGGFARINREINIHGTTAHELGHAIDYERHISNTREWMKVHNKEIVGDRKEPGKLSEYARKNPTEGFAEFSRLLYGSGVKRELVERTFPKVSAFFKKEKLWPE